MRQAVSSALYLRLISSPIEICCWGMGFRISTRPNDTSPSGLTVNFSAAGAGDAAPAAEDGSDADLHADAVFEGGYVGDNADQLIVLAEACKGFEGRVEGVFVESAEPFVEEEGVDPAFGARPIKRFIRREHSQ